MRDKIYDNADSFAISFDEEWKNIDCEDSQLKIDKIFEILSDELKTSMVNGGFKNYNDFKKNILIFQ